MELKTAITLIQEGIRSAGPQTWADLGAGSGLFTTALGTLLPTGSSVYAVDREAEVLDRISWSFQDKKLFRIQDNVENDLTLPLLDGIVLANVIHYVASKPDFIRRLKSHLGNQGVFIIIEYDTTKGNPWVPYPISLSAMKVLAASIGCDIRVLKTVPSKYNSGDLYSALLTQQKSPH